MRVALALLACGTALTAGAQSLVIGSVPVSDATATGVLEVSSGRSVLGGMSSLTTADRPARVTLLRGGELQVCQGSTSRLTGGQTSGKDAPLVVGLDRGALELRLNLTVADAVMTPDLRIVSADSKSHPIDLALRVTANGDTCIDNRGKKAPLMNVSDAFDTGIYQVKPGQRVLFEHGSLREVVDREQGPCGCPSADGMSLADAALSRNKTGAQAYPFPEAVSEGLVPPGPPPPETPGITHTQIATTVAVDPGAEPTPMIAPSPVPAPPVHPPASKPGAFSAIGSFFKHIFVR